MGITENGIFGATTGKVGKLVYYKRKGKMIVRIVGRNDKPASKAQLLSRKKMSVASSFSRCMMPFIQYGFAEQIVGTDKSQFNVLIGYVRKNAMQGQYPDISIDYSKVMLSAGPLLPAYEPTVYVVPEGLKFSWYVANNTPWPDNTDQVMLLAYFPDTQSIVYNLFGALRTAGTATLPINGPLLTKHMETYMAFISADRTQVSDSVYSGGFNQVS